MIPEVEKLINAVSELGYVVEEELGTVLHLLLHMRKPLLLEGPPGVGKTASAKIIAAYLDTELIRLQCYEGLDVNNAIYEWNYQKQLLSIKIHESDSISSDEKESRIFSESYLLKRPLLKAITAKEKAPVLLIDEIDRADEEFEAFLLELLSDFQISIPELGTIKAEHRPVVILTSNRTRELSDALKRRCLYHWIGYPDAGKELLILRKRFPDLEDKLAHQVIEFVHYLRQQKLQKQPGIAETLDWVEGLLALKVGELNKHNVLQSIGCVLKSTVDINKVKEMELEDILVS
jgi:MoxR-like ATPase